jgi:hypothetical protein
MFLGKVQERKKELFECIERTGLLVKLSEITGKDQFIAEGAFWICGEMSMNLFTDCLKSIIEEINPCPIVVIYQNYGQKSVFASLELKNEVNVDDYLEATCTLINWNELGISGIFKTNSANLGILDFPSQSFGRRCLESKLKVIKVISVGMTFFWLASNYVGLFDKDILMNTTLKHFSGDSWDFIPELGNKNKGSFTTKTICCGPLDNFPNIDFLGSSRYCTSAHFHSSGLSYCRHPFSEFHTMGTGRTDHYLSKFWTELNHWDSWCDNFNTASPGFRFEWTYGKVCYHDDMFPFGFSLKTEDFLDGIHQSLVEELTGRNGYWSMTLVNYDNCIRHWKLVKEALIKVISNEIRPFGCQLLPETAKKFLWFCAGILHFVHCGNIGKFRPFLEPLLEQCQGTMPSIIEILTEGIKYSGYSDSVLSKHVSSAINLAFEEEIGNNERNPPNISEIAKAVYPIVCHSIKRVQSRPCESTFVDDVVRLFAGEIKKQRHCTNTVLARTGLFEIIGGSRKHIKIIPRNPIEVFRGENEEAKEELKELWTNQFSAMGEEIPETLKYFYH